MAGLVASLVAMPAVAALAAARGIAVRPLAEAPGAPVRVLPWVAGATLPAGRSWRALLLVAGGSDAVAAGIDAGGDDAVPRGAGADEVVARLAALLRRPHRGTLAVGDLVIDRDARIVLRAGRPLALLPREYALLLHLAERRGRAVSRAALLEALWSTRFDPGTNVVAVQVSRLRARLEAAGPRIVHTDRGGYRLGPAGTGD